MKQRHWSEKLRRMGACENAIEWAKRYKAPATAWRYCKRGDWMLWFLGQDAGESGSDERKPIVLAACKCAQLTLSFLPPKDKKQLLQTIKIIEAWTRGKAGVTINDVRAATYAVAYAAAYAAVNAAADAATYAAVDAVAYTATYAAVDAAADAVAYVAADTATYAATYAAVDAVAYVAADTAAYAATYAVAYAAAYAAVDAAAYAAAYAAAKTKVLAQCADIVRKHFKTPKF